MFHAALGVIWLAQYPAPLMAALALAIYLAAVIPTIVAFDTLALPPFMAVLNLAAAAIIPVLINGQLDKSFAGTYATWYVAAVATLMAATAIRQHRVISWVGLSIMVVQVVIWGGFASITTTGVIGALVLVFAGQAIATGLASASREAQAYVDQATKEASEMASTTAVRDERKRQAAITLRRALPLLQRISETNGNLDDNDRLQARLLESELRDEIRGRNLINDRTRFAIRQARLRGIDVVVFDEGGLDAVSAADRDKLLTQAAAALDECQGGRVTLRAPNHDEWVLTMVCMRPGASAPDRWLRLPAPSSNLTTSQN
jgi:hypothetical protein